MKDVLSSIKGSKKDDKEKRELTNKHSIVANTIVTVISKVITALHKGRAESLRGLREALKEHKDND
jgi:hypothetical protein